MAETELPPTDGAQQPQPQPPQQPPQPDNEMDGDVEDTKEDTDDGVENAKKDTKDKKDEGIYLEQLPNRIVVAKNRPLSYYLDRSRRILRMEDELVVCGRDTSISMSCSLVEVLKRQKIAEIVQVATGMNVEPYFNQYGETRWSQPKAMITFKLNRVVGGFAEHVDGFQQRKVIEIFETKVTKDAENQTKQDLPLQVLSFKQIADLKLGQRFRANDKQKDKAEEFLKDERNIYWVILSKADQLSTADEVDTDEEKEQNKIPVLNLPNFIKFASILIHPLLKDKEFKKIAADLIEELENPPKVEELPQR